MLPVLITVGSFRLYSFGILVALGFIVAMAYCRREALRQGYDPQIIVDLTFWLALAGLAGARLMFVAVNWEHFSQNPGDILRIWQGGLVWYGGLLFAFAVGVLLMRRWQLPVWVTSDLIAPAVMLGLSVGRIGCWAVGDDHGRLVVSALGELGQNLLAHDLLYNAAGWVTDDARHMILEADLRYPWWVMQLPSRSLVQPDLVDLPLYPTQVMMSLNALLVFGLLQMLRIRQSFPGQIVGSMLVLYAVGRFAVEFWRGDLGRGILWGGLSTGHWVSLAVAGLGLLVLAWARPRQMSSARAAG